VDIYELERILNNHFAKVEPGTTAFMERGYLMIRTEDGQKVRISIDKERA